VFRHILIICIFFYFYVLLYFMSNYPLLNYNWGNHLPIANLTFSYGQIGPIVGNGVTGGIWGSLPVSNVFSNNPTLVTINSNGIQFNVSGIYQITTSITFSSPNSGGFTSSNQTFAFSYSTSPNSGSVLTSSNNNITGPISFLDGSNNIILASTPLFINGSASGGGANLQNGFDSSYYGGNVSMLQNTTTTPTSYPPFFLLPNYSNTSTGLYNNVNTITSIYYIPEPTTIYFNIANTSSSSNYINASGNFTVELMNYIVVPSVTNNSNLTSTLNYTNGYYYYTFVPTTTTSSGTATITFPTNVQMNYLLVGGGGGGGGSYYFTSSKYYDGGGGGGGQSINSNINSTSFNITVGNAGPGGTATNNGLPGGSTSLTSNGITTTCNGGGGGLTYPNSTGGTGGGVPGGEGFWYLNNGSVSIQFATNGLSGNTFSLSGIGLTYNVGGSGGGGGSVSGGSSINGGAGGSTVNGGVAGGNSSSTGGSSTGSGTGGGGASVGSSSSGASASGGQGGPGLVVLYWKA
jgi:hypothetical protein